MAIDKGKHIKIDGVSYALEGYALLTPRVITPPRINTSPTHYLESLEEWEHYGTSSFIGGMGQKYFQDKEMYYDSIGINVLGDREARLSRVIEQVKSLDDLGINLEDMGGSASFSLMHIYNGKLYFAANEGDWGTGNGGRIRIWSWNGSSLVDHSCAAAYSTLASGVLPTDTAITVADDTGFSVGDYVFISGNAFGNYELMVITGKSGGGVLQVNRAQSITWAPGKNHPTTAQTFNSGLPVFALTNTPYDSVPIKAGDGVNSMAVIDDKFYVGTYTGFVFMYDTNNWYLQPPSANTLVYQGTSRRSGSIDHQVSAMLPYKDVLYACFGNRLEKYDPAASSGTNPWSGTLHTMRDAYSLNNMVLWGNTIYITSWRDKGDSAMLYKYDGSDVYPVFRFPSRFEIHSAIVYDGKIFLGGGKYNNLGTASVGQLYSYNGTTMRKVFTRPRDDELVANRLYTFYKLMTWDDHLYFGDNYTTGLFCYDAEQDAVHRCNVMPTLTGTSGNLVRGIAAFRDQYYLTITNNGLFRVKTTGVYDTGGSDRSYGNFLYPYIRTSIMGQDFPNLEKLFYLIRLWHSPIVQGQKFHLYRSRNQAAGWSGGITITPETGSTHTEYIFMEEGWDDDNGGFNGTPTGEYGYKGTDLSLVIALETSSTTRQFSLFGYAVAYLPVARYLQRIRVTVNCTDKVEYAPYHEDTDWGIQKMQALWNAYKEQRPVLVEHPFDDRDEAKIMLISGFQAVGHTLNMQEVSPSAEYPLEGMVVLELLEVGET